ncbi:hypothetical protein D770_18320 [Flammeovirgaceae bacterium 311]|nr:hypothetical protein D770_18320 [Flammeovirgaceae bacterium 311]
MFMASMVLSTSCGTQEEEDVTPAAPSISISGVTDHAAATANVGQVVSFSVNVIAPGGFNVIRVDKTVGTGSTVDYAEQSKNPGQTVTSFTYAFTFTPNAAEAGQAVTFDFVVVDDNGKQSEHTFVVTVNEPPINSYQTVLLGGQNNSSVPSFYNARDNASYLMAAAKNNKDKVDFLYYFGATNLATVAAPTNADAQTVYGATNLTGMNNATDFVRTTAVFADITKASDIANAWLEKKSGSVATQVKDLKANDVFAFQLADARGYRIGVAQVVSVEGNYASTAQKITLNIKIQSTDN